MGFVIIERNQNNPPSDKDITTAMSHVGGTVTSIENQGTSKRVDYNGDVHHTEFEQELRRVAGGRSTAWTFVWGDALALASEGVAGALGTQYSITVHNDSQLPNYRAIVFQQQPSLPADVVSLAWLSKVCQPNSQLTYTWTLDYNFVWGQSGQLKPGVNYQAGGTVPADLTSHNQVTLSYPGGGFEFGPTSPGPTAGSLFIEESADVPGYGNSNQGSVGIGMYGQGTFVLPTNPTSGGGIQFSPHPQYWVAFGNYAQGEVVDESVLYAPTQVMFSGGSFNADCVFNGSSWTITYS